MQTTYKCNANANDNANDVGDDGEADDDDDDNHDDDDDDDGKTSWFYNLYLSLQYQVNNKMSGDGCDWDRQTLSVCENTTLILHMDDITMLHTACVCGFNVVCALITPWELGQ